MRQNNDIPRSKRLAQAVGDSLTDIGNTTWINQAMVNGKPVYLMAAWAEAQANRVQQYLVPDEWSSVVYNVIWGTNAVLLAPHNLKDGSEVQLIGDGTDPMIGVVRRWFPRISEDTVIAVEALVKIISYS